MNEEFINAINEIDNILKRCQDEGDITLPSGDPIPTRDVRIFLRAVATLNSYFCNHGSLSNHEVGKAINDVDDVLTKFRTKEITLSNGEPVPYKNFSRSVTILKSYLYQNGILSRDK